MPATWDQAITAINRGLAGLPLADLGLFVGADATLEEGVALEALADALQARHVDHGPRQAVHIAPTATLTDVAQADFVAVLGADLGEEAPVLELRLLEMLRGGVLPPEFAHGTAIADLRLVERPARKTERLAVIGGESRLWTHAGHRIAASGAAALSGLAQPGTPALRAVREALDKAERPVLILGADVLNAAGAPSPRRWLIWPAGPVPRCWACPLARTAWAWVP
ncbi:hypothetical protein [Deinococcus multiflagellatus]|uniref:Uncharacterized protein n=1 Tax=Deinococcus multiflagellatus TaxID=1656887 RepID=A0ABW1ZJV9_9DEIO